MSELKFEGRKWDARNWTREQKIQWQEKTFELGYSWDGEGVHYLDSSYYTTNKDGSLYRSDVSYHFSESSGELLTFGDMFPEEKEEKLDVIKEITELFSESLVDDNVSEEDERGFEGLVYVEPDLPYLDYWYIHLEDLSSEQLHFLSKFFTTDNRFTFEDEEGILMYQKGNSDGMVIWTNYLSRCGSTKMNKVSFNDLFQYEDKLCSVQ